MIEVYPQNLSVEGNSLMINSRIAFGGEDHTLWYKIPAEFREFVVDENLDAFLVGILFLGLERREDIRINGQISEKLFYSLSHYLIPAFVQANPNYKQIKIIPDQLNKANLNKIEAAATGLSCGVDSFATYFTHREEVGSFKIDYFTFFNAGSHGDLGGKRAREVYEQRYNIVQMFAKKENKKLISIDSNLSEILNINFQKSHSIRNISCALNLQKLFRNYYYASAYRLDHFKLNANDTSDADFLILRLLDTESTSFYSSVAQLTRVERTLLISDFPETYDYLDVCTNPWMERDKINCSKCYKCLRTQLTLDIAGELEKYQEVFDVYLFRKIKHKYIGELLYKKNKSPLDRELIDFMNEKNYPLNAMVYFNGFEYRIRTTTLSVKKYIKNLIKSF